MVKLSTEVKEVIQKQKPLPIATADKTGKPNVIFVGMWKFIDDETIMIVDNFLKKTADNLKANPKLSLVAYDAESKKSYQVKGSVDYLEKGAMYDEAQAMALSKKLPGKAVLIFHVEEVYDSVYGPNAGKKIS
ncbi:MAG: pyridoxamine 5'-phosphate oxidase family protein [Methanosarcinales archaeon]|nr:pyridoxamine 5'-phosphate oxidase family protein [ANME-2 cluster archaeon]MDF1530786.1 pyridoxamine 5'-phosphate oxidase family protein [ANME-2 cluster archaeon]MDW7777125.1 pyridoxamine 5'-phosphate oxidase family protein [Methanosarcinales archaeon]